MTNNISSICKGYSHEASGKPCQDFVYSESTPELSMAIVSDGHGGERYFRSDKGAKFVVEIAKQSIRTFVNALSSGEASIAKEYGDTPLFKGMPLTQYSEATASVFMPGKERQGKYIHVALTGLFKSILTQWNMFITKHALNSPLNEWELKHVEEKYRIEFEEKLKEDDPSFAKTYGCTLIAYVQTPDYWFAFHIGDGKCICFDVENEQLKITQPIPWDEKCFLNKTTSICDSHALSEFRYCYQGDGHFPEAMFIGSDGIDDSYGDNIDDFYIQLFKMLSDKDKAQRELNKSLPIISQHGSQDDMSVASVYNDSNLTRTCISLVQYQIDKIDEQSKEVKCKLESLDTKLKFYCNAGELTGHDAVVYNYTVKDIEKFGKLRDSLHGKKLNLYKELKKFRCMLESLPIEEESQEAVPYDELEHPESELLQNISDEFKKNEPVSEEIGNNIIEE
jgi:serine/threonine protein phosphatase PrpC